MLDLFTVYKNNLGQTLKNPQCGHKKSSKAIKCIMINKDLQCVYKSEWWLNNVQNQANGPPLKGHMIWKLSSVSWCGLWNEFSRKEAHVIVH